MRVWGEVKSLFQMAKDKFDYLPGFLIDSKHAISTDDVSEGDNVRDLRKGMIGIPCVQNGKFIGLSKWVGIKQKRMRLIADEAAMMGAGFLSAFANLDGNEDFRAIILGNPNDPMDPLGRAAEPRDGWTRHLEPTKTEVWDTKFMGGRCVNLIGTDSPNFDFPANEPTRYKYLISREKIANTLSFFAKDTAEYYTQCVGSMKVGVLSRRVITRDLCKQFNAMEPVIWSGKPLTKIGGLDAAYGGLRLCRCVSKTRIRRQRTKSLNGCGIIASAIVFRLRISITIRLGEVLSELHFQEYGQQHVTQWNLEVQQPAELLPLGYMSWTQRHTNGD